MKDYLTTKQLADRWGMSEGTLRNWRYENKGPSYQSLGDGQRAIIIYDLGDIKEYEKKYLKKKIKKAI